MKMQIIIIDITNIDLQKTDFFHYEFLIWMINNNRVLPMEKMTIILYLNFGI